jgi:hypothetical protein
VQQSLQPFSDNKVNQNSTESNSIIENTLFSSIESINKGIFTDLPFTGKFIQQLVSGNFTNAVNITIASASEVKHKLTNFVTEAISRQNNSSWVLDSSSWSTPIYSLFSNGSRYAFDGGIGIIALIVSVLVYSFDLAFKLSLFVVILFTFTFDQGGVLYHVGKLMRILDPRERLKADIEHAVQSILVVNLKLTLFHILFGWLSFSIAGCEVS